MKTIINYASILILGLLMADFLFVLYYLLRIGSGIPTDHIYWLDSQARLVVNLLK
jgi:hypothetical protein